MKYDIFLSICQTEVDGEIPSERKMFENFFDQVKLADDLGFGTAWVAETHLSCQVQKENPNPVIPHFKGEIGLNTDILQLAHKVFSMTKNINVGSAIRNIFCNGGPLAHAEAIRTFLTYHTMDPEEKRVLNIGFASGRFEFSNRPYGIVPRSQTERVAWPLLKGRILYEATEIFLKALRGDVFSSADIAPKILKKEDFRTEEHWQQTLDTYAKETGLSSMEAAKVSSIEIPPFWNFDKVGVIPFDAPLDLLKLTIGTHDPKIQKLANELMPVDVFNLSITPQHVIEETHERMSKEYNSKGGPWKRENMPRTAMIFLNDDEGASKEEQSKRAREASRKALANYWKAMEGTLDEEKVEKAVNNSLAGNPEEVAALINEKYHKDDRIMLWFDLNNHNNEEIKNSMRIFNEKVAPLCKS